MSVVNLSNPEQFIGGAKYAEAVNPQIATSLGRDVFNLSTIQEDAFFHPPITEEGASQPVYYSLIKMAWLSVDTTKPLTNPLLDPKLEQTARLIEHADAVDEAFGIETINRYVLLYNARAVLFPHEDLGAFAINTGLLGKGKLSWHDHETGVVFEDAEMVPGDLVVVNGNYTHSAASTGNQARIILAQLVPADKFPN